MIPFLQRLFLNPTWKEGKLRCLLDREALPAASVVEGVPSESVEQALRMFCDAFNIPTEQQFCLRPSDRIDAIYREMAQGMIDDMEYERLVMLLEEALGRKVSEQEIVAIVTIEDLVRFLHETRAEA